jgi:hypothetical protein
MAEMLPIRRVHDPPALQSGVKPLRICLADRVGFDVTLNTARYYAAKTGLETDFVFRRYMVVYRLRTENCLRFAFGNVKARIHRDTLAADKLPCQLAAQRMPIVVATGSQAETRSGRRLLHCPDR